MNTQIITRILAKMNESRRRGGWNKIGTEESALRWRGRPGGGAKRWMEQHVCGAEPGLGWQRRWHSRGP